MLLLLGCLLFRWTTTAERERKKKENADGRHRPAEKNSKHPNSSFSSMEQDGRFVIDSVMNEWNTKE
jgi:hypothetical protein